MSQSSVKSPASLWEKRKVEAMSRIQRVALELFDRHGYREVTVERVATAAGVSPSSIYRYFGTKEMLVLYDEVDPEVLEVLREAGNGETLELAELVAIARALAPVAVDTIITADVERRTRTRMQYVRAIPEVRDRQVLQMRAMEEQFHALFAQRSGRDANDLVIRVAAATAIWGCMAALDHWAGTDFERPLREVYGAVVESVLAALTAITG
ncbi:TetR family transcriptional regulator [Nocardia sp. 2]|uniref:TetR family transcriptional regulator n=1 Tax=Nocardia acididurans TaxID=2802282 RepID=A0ABS1MBG2_9NOCA|nr:TetR/AcrR family transcriptional regulator [Nocardia acididurans]MBL1077971.1 TetR family transcriptional regulator [Nocardia acididurans]